MYYWPQASIYLSPEPMLQSPNFVSGMAASGMTAPTYSYAANNPVRYTDSTGLWLDYDHTDVSLVLALHDILVNPKLGPLVRQIIADKKNGLILRVRHDNGSWLNEGGGHASPASASDKGGKFSQCEVNPESHWTFAHSNGRDPAYTLTFPQLIAHELGHGFGYVFGGGDRAMEWERALPRDGPYRPDPWIPSRAMNIRTLSLLPMLSLVAAGCRPQLGVSEPPSAQGAVPAAKTSRYSNHAMCRVDKDCVGDALCACHSSGCSLYPDFTMLAEDEVCHLCFPRAERDEMLLAVRSDGGWMLESAPDAGWFPSLAALRSTTVLETRFRARDRGR